METTFNERAEAATSHCDSCGPNNIRHCGACVCHQPKIGWNPVPTTFIPICPHCQKPVDWMAQGEIDEISECAYCQFVGCHECVRQHENRNHDGCGPD